MNIEKKDNGTLLVRDVRILPGPFRNFGGNPDRFNPTGGKRYFHIVIDDPDVAQQMREDGWNVRILQPREEGDAPVSYLKIAIKYPDENSNGRAPCIVRIGKNTRTPFDAETIGLLDNAFITRANVSFRPYDWSTPNGSGRAAYLRTLHVVLEEEDFAEDLEAFDEAQFDDAPF